MNRTKGLSLALVMVFLGMFAIPLVAVNTKKPQDGMLVVLFLFYALNPVISVILGITSGKNIKFFWFVPVIVTILFCVFSLVTYRTEFPMVYSRIHLVLCGISMVITAVLNRKVKCEDKL